jgi:c(7)-type cytochrome triheme protein
MLQKILSRQKFAAHTTVLVAQVVLLLSLSCSYEPEQPINFSHETHFQYFVDGTHKKANFEMHEDILGEIPEELENGECLECHADFEEEAEDIPKIEDCAGCHQIFLRTNLREKPMIRPCVGCHRNVIRGHNASIPNIEICIACHKEPISENPEEAKLVVHINNSERINWIRVNNYIKGDTHFSHERHVAMGNVDCRECHGNVDKISKPFALKTNLKMENCMDCHEKFGVDNDCLACHY